MVRVELSRSRAPLLSIKAPQIFLNVGPDLLAFGALEISKDSFLPVEVEHRSRGGLEHLQSVPHRLSLVVLPLNKILTSLVVFPGNLDRKCDLNKYVRVPPLVCSPWVG